MLVFLNGKDLLLPQMGHVPSTVTLDKEKGKSHETSPSYYPQEGNITSKNVKGTEIAKAARLCRPSYEELKEGPTCLFIRMGVLLAVNYCEAHFHKPLSFGLAPLQHLNSILKASLR